MSIEEFQRCIVNAMVRSCADMVGFTDNPAKPINAEYLFTVNVAKELRKFNFGPGDPYRIHLEERTKVLARRCLYPVRFGKPMVRGSTRFRRGTPKINRNGRVDIAVYEDLPNNGYMGHQPVCVVELKGFNPQIRSALLDMKRNLEFLRLSGNTGRSVLRFTVFSALHKFGRSTDEQKAQANEDELLTKYRNSLAQLGNLDDVKVEVQVQTVSKELVGRVLDEGEYKVLDTSAVHHFAGVMVTFSAKEI